MKKIIYLLLITFFAFSFANAQKKISAAKVPQEVMKSYNIKFPSAKKVIWRKIDVLYEAQVFIDKKVSFATFEAGGSWIETLTEIKVSEIPSEVVEGVKKLYSSAIIKAAAIIEQSTNETLYIVQFRFKGKRGEVTLDKSGNQT
ncbi:MAG: hypothetical protein V1904_02400 [Bacteroidota bacterium]